MSGYDMHDWDLYGWPGEYIHGEDVYLPDEYMDERWLPVKDFPNYWVSDKGRLWSNKSNSFVNGTPVGKCGHIDVNIYYGRVRFHRYMHRLVAEAFIPNPHGYPIVRHLDDNPSNNCVENLAWGTQSDNMQDCISSNRFRYFTPEDIETANQKRRMPIKAVKLSSGRILDFNSQREASRMLGIRQSEISAVICGKRKHANGYYFYVDENELPIDINNYKYVRHNVPIRAIDIRTGDEFIFNGQTEVARELGMSVSSVSMVLSGKMRSARGYIFEYVDDEEEYYD